MKEPRKVYFESNMLPSIDLKSDLPKEHSHDFPKIIKHKKAFPAPLELKTIEQ